METQRVPSWVWTVLVGVHVVALSWALSTGHWRFPDSGRYLQAADNLRLHGELYAKPWPAQQPHGQAVQEFTIRPLGYPLLILILGMGRAEAAPVGLLVVQNLLSVLNIGLVLVWWARWARPTAARWRMAVAGILTFPAQFIYANAVMSELMLQTVVVGLVVASLWYIRSSRMKYAVWVALALVVAWLLKPIFYPLAGVAAVGGMLLAWRYRSGALGLIGIMPGMLLLLYMSWNAHRTGYFQFSSITEINLLHYNAAGVVRQTAGPAAEEKWVANVLAVANAQPCFAVRQQIIRARAQAVLAAHPVVYARQHLQGMAAFFLDPGRFDVSEFWGLAPPVGGGLLAQARVGGLLRAIGSLPLGLLVWLGVALLANAGRLWLAVRGFCGMGQAGTLWRRGRWVAAGLLLYVAGLTGPLGATRFLVPVWPLLLGLALAGWQGKPAARRETSEAGVANR